MLGIGLMGTFCEMAWNQGIDLYGHAGNRFMKACEYVAKYNLGENVPFTAYTVRQGAPGVWEGYVTMTESAAAGRGPVRPVWELIYNHYAGRRSLAVPYTTRYAALARPEGGGAYKLINVMSGNALDNGNVAIEGGPVVQWSDNGGIPQRWRLTRVG
ncbi:RICIN domain-containing protein [Nonomuraea sp. NPDC003201]